MLVNPQQLLTKNLDLSRLKFKKRQKKRFAKRKPEEKQVPDNPSYGAGTQEGKSISIEFKRN